MDLRKPSEVLDDYWIRVKNESRPYTGSKEFVGKWIEFVYLRNVDEVWSKIRDATVKGLLGVGAKVATSRPNPLSIKEDLRLICVYTYDWRDRVDALRVRRALRELGIIRKISYKSDEDTYAGRYRAEGYTNISKYYSDGTEDVLEDYVPKKSARRARYVQQKRAREYIRTHPDEVERVKQKYNLP